MNSECNHSLSSLIPPDRQASISEEARCNQVASATLLESADDPSIDSSIANGGDITGVIGRTVGAWMKSAANFISNESPLINERRRSMQRTSSINIIQRKTPIEKIVDATDSICSYPNCIQSLNIAVSRFHCRKCNGWYCAAHAGHPSLGMKLVPATGEPDSARGIWSRVCYRCFQERHYNNSEPLPERSRTELFKEKRAVLLQERMEMTQKLERRLRKLAEFDEKKDRVPFRIYERKVVKWEEDQIIQKCRNCQVSFSTLIRKHHCRLCGKIMCGEVTCSAFYPLKLFKTGSVELRICSECDFEVFTKASIRATLTAPSRIGALRKEMRQVEDQIKDILPEFNRKLLSFEYEIDKEKPDQKRLIGARKDAFTARETLMCLFKHYEGVRRSLGVLSAKTRDEETIIKNIQRAAVAYLQKNMFTLQMLPKLDLKRLKKPMGAVQSTQPVTRTRAPSIVSIATTTGNFVSELFSKSLSLLEPPPEPPMPQPANLSTLQVKFEVLHEQKSQLATFIAEAAAAGKFDEVRTLRMSLEQVNAEIVRLKGIFECYQLQLPLEYR